MVSEIRQWARVLWAVSSLALFVGLAPPAMAQEAPDAVLTAQSPPPDPPSDLASPRATMQTFLQAAKRLQRDAAFRARAAERDAARCFDLGGVPPEAQPELTSQMATVLSRFGVIAPSLLPDSMANGQELFILFPDAMAAAPDWSRPEGFAAARDAAPNGLIAFELQRDGTWRFNSETVAGLAQLRNSVESLPVRDRDLALVRAGTLSERVRSAMPSQLKGESYVGLELWQWIGILAIIFVGFVADHVTRFIVRRIWLAVTTRRGKRPREERELQLAVRPFGLFAAASVWYGLLQLLGLPPLALMILLVAARVVLMLASVMAAFRLVDLIAAYMARRAKSTRTKVDDLLVPLMRKAAKVFLAALGVIYIAESFQIEIIPLLTGLGIGGVAFAFAAKDTVENFFGSVAVILDRPFEVGDWVVIEGVEGTVEELGLRSTRVRTFYNSLVTVPNATLVRAQVDNYGKRKYRRFKAVINVTYGTPPERIEAFCEGIRELVRAHPYTRKDYYHVWLNELGAHSLDILLYVFHETPDWATELRERHRLLIDITRLAKKLGVDFAFPTQTLHMIQEGGDPLDPQDPAPHDDLRRMVDGRRAARQITSDARWRRETPGQVQFNGGSDEVEAEVEATENAVKIDQTEVKL
ncbi:MAG: mechanosensitive ion channel family protein [Planctomycetota bacterium]